MAEGGEELEMENLIDDNDNDRDSDYTTPPQHKDDYGYIDDNFDADHLSLLKPHSPPLPQYTPSKYELDNHEFDKQHVFLFGEGKKISLGRRAINRIKYLFQSSEYREIDALEMDDTSLWGRVKGSSRFTEIIDKVGNFKKKLPKKLRKKLGESFHTKLQRNAWLNEEASRRQEILRRENEIDQNNLGKEIDNVDPAFNSEGETQKRTDARNEQSDRIQDEVDKRNREDEKIIDRLLIKEKVRAIFKKYGLTIASIMLAIWAVVATIIGATQSITVGDKKQDPKPESIPSIRLNKSIPTTPIINFIFDIALEVIEDLVENSFLLIELLVIFYIDNRR